MLRRNSRQKWLCVRTLLLCSVNPNKSWEKVDSILRHESLSCAFFEVPGKKIKCAAKTNWNVSKHAWFEHVEQSSLQCFELLRAGFATKQHTRAASYSLSIVWKQSSRRVTHAQFAKDVGGIVTVSGGKTCDDVLSRARLRESNDIWSLLSRLSFVFLDLLESNFRTSCGGPGRVGHSKLSK